LRSFNERPLFSVVTVCFNNHKTIAETMESVRNQRGVTFEHIIIDGGSVDGTLDIINDYKDQLAHVISGKDNGVYDAMQKGLSLATGQFTGFLNGDDYFTSSDSLQRLVGHDNPLMFDGLCAVIDQIDQNGRIVRVIGGKEITERQLLWGKFPPHPATYLRTDLMKDAGGFDQRFRIVGDMDMYLRCKDKATKPFCFKTESIVRMRLGGLSTRGFSSYLAVGREMLMALRRSQRSAQWLRIQGRILFKMNELVFKRSV
jgi:glycosyltransferase involved in cell wall biosynthesis